MLRVATRPFSIYSNVGLEKLIRANASITTIKSPLIIAATDYTRGELKAFYASKLIDRLVDDDTRLGPEQQRLNHFRRIATTEVLIKALLASSAIPVVPLYISLLYKIMKAEGTHEGTAQQIARLFRDHLAPGQTPKLDVGGRIRVDDLEMQPQIQRRISEFWDTATTENLFALTDYGGFKQEFRSLFGFEVPGIDYAVPVETDVPL